MKVRLYVTETLQHVVTADLTKEQIKELEGPGGSDIAGDMTSSKTLEDGSYDLEDIDYLDDES